MTHEELLTQLKDVHQAPPPSWWPPAFGYYVVVLIVFALLCVLYFFMRLRTRARVKRLLLDELNEIERQFHAHDDASAVQASLSSLLRRLAFALNDTVPKNSDIDAVVPILARVCVDKEGLASVISLLKQDRYRPEPQVDGALLITLTREQIKRCRI